MKVLVRRVAGSTLSLEIGSGDTTVGRLKSMIYVEEGIVPSLQKLIYGGDEMADDRRIQSFKLDNDQCSIDLVVRRFSDHTSSFSSSAGLQSQQPGHLRGYFFHPTTIKQGVQRYSAARPVQRYPLRYVAVGGRRELRLDEYIPVEASGYEAMDSHLGLVVLQRPAEKGLPAITVWDPASSQFACLPPPPAEALKQEQNGVIVINDSSFDNDPENVGGVILSRKSGDTLQFELGYITVERKEEGMKPKAWVATYDGESCIWQCGRLSSSMLNMEEPIYMDRYCVRANGRLFWHLHGSADWSAISLDPVQKTLNVLQLPRAESRIGEDSDGGLIAASVGPYEHLYVSKQVKSKSSCKWSPMVSPYGLSDALDEVPSLNSRVRRVTRLTDFDPGYPRSVLIKTSGNGKFRYHINTGRLERLVTSAGMEWGHPIFPYFL